MSEPKKAKVIKAAYDLQAKVGSGPLNKDTVQACEDVIENNQIDFSPVASDFLKQLETTIEKARAKELSGSEALQQMAQPVMGLKANASVFKYDLVGNLATVMLSFLESLKEIDNTALEIVSAHHKTLSAIIIKKMSGDGGETGKTLEQELKDACQRYFSKKQ